MSYQFTTNWCHKYKILWILSDVIILKKVMNTIENDIYKKEKKISTKMMKRQVL